MAYTTSVFASEPFVNRNGDAHLRPLDDLLRNVPVKHLAQQSLLDAVLEFVMGRQSRGELENAVIEQRLAAFETDRHGGAVDLGEDVVREVGLVVDGEHARECVVVAVEAREVVVGRRNTDGSRDDIVSKRQPP